ncbi:MAG: DNA methyltransferase [Polaromonas sp.]|nr:DNA methyltransferase [Polaromonas sp.]
MLVIESPKRSADLLDTAPYAYYAGYSQSFVKTLLENLPLARGAVVLDPWNGSGTTTAIASQLGIKSIGVDLNPVMNIVARCRLSDGTERTAIDVWAEIRPLLLLPQEISREDPLTDWFSPSTSSTFRRILDALVGGDSLETSKIDFNFARPEWNSVSNCRIALACFSAINDLLQPLRASNPTWLKRPRLDSEKISKPRSSLISFIEQKIFDNENRLGTAASSNSKILQSSSMALPLRHSSVDLVITSPPYCTRIDYAVATSGELAFLGYGRKTNYLKLRTQLIGTTMVQGVADVIPESLGFTCVKFLNALRSHTSKASSTYYLKNHLAYFISIKKSISEIARTLKPNGVAVFVVQDSWYKALHNDVPKIFEELCEQAGLKLFQREDFESRQSMGNLHRAKHAHPRISTEVVLAFYKPGGT